MARQKAKRRSSDLVAAAKAFQAFVQKKLEKVSQRELAAEWGVAQSLIAGYSAGQKLPNFENIVKILRSTGTSPYSLFGRKE